MKSLKILYDFIIIKVKDFFITQIKVLKMNKLYIFLIRVLLGGVFALIIQRFFYPNSSMINVVILGALLILIAYTLEYFRKK